MSRWDEAAETHLEAVAAHLREVGVVSLLRGQVQAVWRRNVDGHDPLLGDTSLSLGVHCSENLRELVVRECTGGSSPWRARGVAASVVDRSLRLDVAGVRVGLVKAPPRPSDRTPQWDGAAFRWESESEVRLAAAERNSAAYRPSESEQDGRSLALPLETATPDATHLRDLWVVWSGQLEPALTAGWIGFPSAGRPSWFAVEPLWWDEPGEGGERRRDPVSPSAGADFEDLPTPEPSIRLKGRRDTGSGQATS